MSREKISSLFSQESEYGDFRNFLLGRDNKEKVLEFLKSFSAINTDSWESYETLFEKHLKDGTILNQENVEQVSKSISEKNEENIYRDKLFNELIDESFSVLIPLFADFEKKKKSDKDSLKKKKEDEGDEEEDDDYDEDGDDDDDDDSDDSDEDEKDDKDEDNKEDNKLDKEEEKQEKEGESEEGKVGAGANNHQSKRLSSSWLAQSMVAPQAKRRHFLHHRLSSQARKDFGNVGEFGSIIQVQTYNISNQAAECIKRRDDDVKAGKRLVGALFQYSQIVRNSDDNSLLADCLLKAAEFSDVLEELNSSWVRNLDKKVIQPMRDLVRSEVQLGLELAEVFSDKSKTQNLIQDHNKQLIRDIVGILYSFLELSKNYYKFGQEQFVKSFNDILEYQGLVSLQNDRPPNFQKGEKCNLDNIQTVIQGLLQKKGAKRHNWKTRFFVLQSKYLLYFNNLEEKIYKGLIVLENCIIEENDRKPFGFTITTPNRTFYIAANNDTEQRKWIDILQSCSYCIYSPNTSTFSSIQRSDIILVEPQIFGQLSEGYSTPESLEDFLKSDQYSKFWRDFRSKANPFIQWITQSHILSKLIDYLIHFTITSNNNNSNSNLSIPSTEGDGISSTTDETNFDQNNNNNNDEKDYKQLKSSRQKKMIRQKSTDLLSPNPNSNSVNITFSDGNSNIEHVLEFASLAANILTSDEKMVASIVQEPSILARFFSILNEPAPLLPIRSQFFCDVLHYMLTHRPSEIFGYIHDHQFIPRLIEHIASERIFKLLINMWTYNQCTEKVKVLNSLGVIAFDKFLDTDPAFSSSLSLSSSASSSGFSEVVYQNIVILLKQLLRKHGLLNMRTETIVLFEKKMRRGTLLAAPLDFTCDDLPISPSKSMSDSPSISFAETPSPIDLKAKYEPNKDDKKEIKEEIMDEIKEEVKEEVKEENKEQKKDKRAERKEKRHSLTLGTVNLDQLSFDTDGAENKDKKKNDSDNDSTWSSDGEWSDQYYDGTIGNPFLDSGVDSSGNLLSPKSPKRSPQTQEQREKRNSLAPSYMEDRIAPFMFRLKNVASIRKLLNRALNPPYRRAVTDCNLDFLLHLVKLQKAKPSAVDAKTVTNTNNNTNNDNDNNNSNNNNDTSTSNLIDGKQKIPHAIMIEIVNHFNSVYTLLRVDAKKKKSLDANLSSPSLTSSSSSLNSSSSSVSTLPPPPIGFYRYNLIRLIRHLVESEFQFIDKALVETKLISRCCDLFFTYKNHSILLNTVQEMLVASFTNDSTHSSIVSYLVRKYHLPKKIIAHFEEADQMKEEKNIVYDSIPHLVLIVNAMSKSRKAKKFLKKNTRWKRFVKRKIQPLNQLYSPPPDKPILDETTRARNSEKWNLHWDDFNFIISS